MKFRLNFFKVNKTDSCLNFLKVNKTDFYLNFKNITADSFLNFFKITEFCNLIKSARFLRFAKREFESLNSSATEDKKSLKDTSESLK